MENNGENLELFKKYRPRSFKGVVGSQSAVRTLREFASNDRIPHAILLTGPSGCGKTTLARIVRRHLECSEEDYVEVNSADFRGIDTIREIRQRMRLNPMLGKVRMWCIDEAHKLTNDAQNALLKLLEETPPHVYFALTTTESEKLLTTIKTRCTEVRVEALNYADMKTLLERVLEKEGKQGFPSATIDQIIEVAEGSARKALVILNQVIHIQDEKDQIDAILKSESKVKATEIAIGLIYKNISWADMCEVLKGLDTDEEPERIRHAVLTIAKNALLANKGPRINTKAYRVIFAFEENFFSSKMAGLVRACYEVISGGDK